MILGQPFSKANRRELVVRRYRDEADQLHTRPMSIRSAAARAYEAAALPQIPVACRQRFTGPVCVRMTVFYASARPDLDESLILDVLQDRWTWVKTTRGRVRELVQAGIYRNDRQISEKHVRKGIDRASPRAETEVEPLSAQQLALPFGEI
ncbi:hypothetical protein [Paraburkholderia adhaesiva]|uniref:hypothetical protein n=1 Tax=Paraburkholderia adhaesiva TaxID=2883244 RepID=UPI001F176C13|nr:hypothetical protein [Paraburkholderia adhaesiva]